MQVSCSAVETFFFQYIHEDFCLVLLLDLLFDLCLFFKPFFCRFHL